MGRWKPLREKTLIEKVQAHFDGLIPINTRGRVTRLAVEFDSGLKLEIEARPRRPRPVAVGGGRQRGL